MIIKIIWVIYIFIMKQQSQDEEGFIPSGFQINRKAHNTSHHHKNNHVYLPNTYYRYCGYFIKKEHPLSLNTPLTLTHQTGIQAPLLTRPKNKTESQHPYKLYGCSSEFYQIYNKHSDQPFVYQSEFIKNQVSLFNIQDGNSPSLKQLKPFQQQQPQKQVKDDDLVFDSKFESGNLHCAFRKKETNQYHLFIENDTNTLGYNQWFYFSVRNMRKNVKYMFYVVNYRKRLRFFEEGQRIVMFSRIDAEEHKNGWRRVGNNYCLELSAFSSSLQKEFYTLSFSMQFPHNNDYVALASSLPYSYTKLLQELRLIQNEARKNSGIKISIESIGTTICNNQVPEVTITNLNSEKKERDKKIVIFMARQHPGEVWSSYKAEGFIRAFLRDTPQIKYILEHYIIKVIPMINVDGVIYGNFRCDVTGVDLNRRWKYPSKIFHPHLVQIKQKIISYHKKWKVELCIDLHGHSKKYNIFCYSCKHNSYTCRILPYLIEKENKIFDMPSCTFGLTKDKQSTARAAISQIIKSQNVLTLQTSTFGWNTSTKSKHFNPLDLFKFMQNICVALSYFLDKQSVSYRQANKEVHSKISQFYKYDEQNQEQSGSQSEPEEDQIDFQTKLSTIFDKKYEAQFKSFQQCLEDNYEDTFSQQPVIQQEELRGSPTSPTVVVKEKSKKSPEIKQQKQLIKTTFPTNKKSITLDSLRQATSKPGNSSKSGVYTSQKQRTKNVKSASRNFISREKKRVSINPDQKSHLQISTLHPPTIIQTVPPEIIKASSLQEAQRKDLSLLMDKKKQKSTSTYFRKESQRTKQINQLQQEGKEFAIKWKVFKQSQLKEDKRQDSSSFFQRFQRYIPFGSSSSKKNLRLDLLEQGLQNDDTSFQLNLMFENKRRLQLRKLQKTRQNFFIETTTKREIKKQPLTVFSRMKQTQRLKQQMRRLQQLSERDLECDF